MKVVLKTFKMVMGAVLLMASLDAWCGAQSEEDLADAVRSALASAVALDLSAPEPFFPDRLQQARWLGKMAAKLPTRHLPELDQRVKLLKTVHYEAMRAGLDPLLVLGLIEVESGFQRFAVSSAGAVGYMQIMPFWTRAIGDGDPNKLFNMRVNLRFGCVILRHYLEREKGDLFMALGRYNGSRGRAEYPNAVLSAAKRWGYEP